MRLADEVTRRVARLERYGFTAQQARALATAGYDLFGVTRLDLLVGAA